MSDTARRMTGAAHLVLGALVGTGLVVASAPPAAAHTALEASSPKDGGRIDRAPTELLMDFSYPILTTGYKLVVQGPDGKQYQSGPPQIADDKLTQPLKPLGPVGLYQVRFRIVAGDGHPLNSAMKFTLTKPGPALGGAKASKPQPFFSVSTSTVRDAPAWGPWTLGALAVIFVSGSVFFGRRVTRGLD